MTQLSLYPEAPVHKALGASQESAIKVASRAETLRERVLARLGQFSDYGLTADECAAYLDESILSIRPRFSELVAMGKIVSTGKRRANDSGHSAIVWRKA
jgi:hypothetical protein